jgi:hypothetical protein
MTRLAAVALVLCLLTSAQAQPVLPGNDLLNDCASGAHKEL